MKRRGLLLRILRASMLTMILLAIHLKAGRQAERASAKNDWRALLPTVQRIAPQVMRLSHAESDDSASQLVAYGESEVVGRVLRTSPLCDSIIGFSGPTDAVIVVDESETIIGIELLRSGDTPDHFDAVRYDEFFLQSFRGKPANEVMQIDAVSGATLTSLAIIDAVQRSLTNPGESTKPAAAPSSLRFPKPPEMSHVRLLFPDANEIAADQLQPILWKVQNAQGHNMGSLLRSPPITDSLIGYQGPSELLIAVNPTGAVIGVTIGGSFDNEPYVGYVRDDRYFRTLFNTSTIAELSQQSPNRIEGVSGATMTSQSMAKGIIMTAQAWVDLQKKPNPEIPATAQSESPDKHSITANRQVRTCISIVLILAGIVLGLTRLRGHRRLRLGFQISLIVWLGFIQGELISQAMFAGWASNGIPWDHATGLIVLSIAALAVPVFTGRNIYCSHLCPHGIAQQLGRNLLPFRRQPGPRVSRLLNFTAPILLLSMLAIALLRLPVSLVDFEPFDAWLWPIAGMASISIAVIGLGLSLVFPMLYCRAGCPTGYLLDLLSQQAGPFWTRRDTFVLAVTLLALLLP